MTRTLQRQLEDELDVEKNLGVDLDELNPNKILTPREDDTFSPLHDEKDDDEEQHEDEVPEPSADVAAEPVDRAAP